jgi:SAM-dependent methyltransferase
MRITYRNKGVKEYWTSRWEQISADAPMENLNIYPLKYAEMTVKGDKEGTILEAGCGAGRILRYYHDRGYDIIGMDYIEVAISKLREIDTSLKVEVGDITNLNYPDERFKYVLAYGLYHNLENGLDFAISETYRVLEHGGKVCASFRADNIQNRITDYQAKSKSRSKKSFVPGSGQNAGKSFHKMNLTKNEFVSLFEDSGFKLISVSPVTNMPLMYKFRLFRAKNHKDFDENIARKEGYQLSGIGRLFQNGLMKLFPNQFCNIYVIIAEKI